MEYKRYSLQLSKNTYKEKLRHTTMQITRQRNRSTLFKIMLKELDNTWATTLKGNSRKQNQIQDKLSSGISITLMITGSPRIYSHQ